MCLETHLLTKGDSRGCPQALLLGHLGSNLEVFFSNYLDVGLRPSILKESENVKVEGGGF